MPQPKHIMRLPVPNPKKLDKDLQKYFKVCQEKLGLVPYVLRALAARPQKLRNFINTYNELMLGDSGL
ncbi:MAG: alkylhydroperoxidase, partial [Alphaproteobacteria bacterium]|nr:alkylhydroperoxidase [Alphaproteobacteria bacterium]